MRLKPRDGRDRERTTFFSVHQFELSPGLVIWAACCVCVSVSVSGGKPACHSSAVWDCWRLFRRFCERQSSVLTVRPPLCNLSLGAVRPSHSDACPPDAVGQRARRCVHSVFSTLTSRRKGAVLPLRNRHQNNPLWILFLSSFWISCFPRCLSF